MINLADVKLLTVSLDRLDFIESFPRSVLTNSKGVMLNDPDTSPVIA